MTESHRFNQFTIMSTPHLSCMQIVSAQCEHNPPPEVRKYPFIWLLFFRLIGRRYNLYHIKLTREFFLIPYFKLDFWTCLPVHNPWFYPLVLLCSHKIFDQDSKILRWSLNCFLVDFVNFSNIFIWTWHHWVENIILLKISVIMRSKRYHFCNQQWTKVIVGVNGVILDHLSNNFAITSSFWIRNWSKLALFGAKFAHFELKLTHWVIDLNLKLFKTQFLPMLVKFEVVLIISTLHILTFFIKIQFSSKKKMWKGEKVW